jgi:adenylate cyclase
MPRETATLAILFADIAKSTHLYEVLGNQSAKALIDSCLSIMMDITKKLQGTVIKTIGDELMCTFHTADDAIEAGKAMHESLEQLTIPDKPGQPPPNIYVGLHYGPVIKEGGDVFGDAVNVAARMVSMAKQRQIVTNEETLQHLSDEYKEAANCIDKTTVKGKSGEVKIYEIVWEQHDVTVMLDDDNMGAQELKCRMEIKYRDSEFVIDENKPALTLGRQIHNDVVVNDTRVSRSHSRIEYNRGKFVLIDQSSNGTGVLIQGKKNITIKRDEASLIGNGVICLGREADPSSDLAIHYTIKL